MIVFPDVGVILLALGSVSNIKLLDSIGEC